MRLAVCGFRWENLTFRATTPVCAFTGEHSALWRERVGFGFGYGDLCFIIPPLCQPCLIPHQLLFASVCAFEMCFFCFVCVGKVICRLLYW